MPPPELLRPRSAQDQDLGEDRADPWKLELQKQHFRSRHRRDFHYGAVAGVFGSEGHVAYGDAFKETRPSSSATTVVSARSSWILAPSSGPRLVASTTVTTIVALAWAAASSPRRRSCRSEGETRPEGDPVDAAPNKPRFLHDEDQVTLRMFVCLDAPEYPRHATSSGGVAKCGRRQAVECFMRSSYQL